MEEKRLKIHKGLSRAGKLRWRRDGVKEPGDQRGDQ